MIMKASIYLHLFGTALLATGCTTYTEYSEQRDELECEIRVACGQQDGPCVAEDRGRKDSCTKYHRDAAESCIEALEEQLSTVEDDPDACEGLLTPSICGLATESRQGGRCGTVVEGRPLRHEGELVLAEVTRGEAWSAVEAACEPVASKARLDAAARWLEIARYEHASVAAFARVSLELMTVGAPPALVEGCHRAALDEIGHARLALDLARTLGAEAWDLGPLPQVPTRPVTLEQLAIDALIEGCLGEGAAAACAHMAAARADGLAAATARTIAAEETRHAALAWSTLHWALRRDPTLAAPLARAFADALAQRRERARITWPHQGSLAAYGLLDDAEIAELDLDVAERVVAPVLARLLREARTATAGTTACTLSPAGARGGWEGRAWG